MALHLTERQARRLHGQRGGRYGVRRSKYNAQRTTVDGWTFDSKAEARRYQQLLIRGLAGEIRNLELQPRFPLPYNAGSYVADFRYEERGVHRFVSPDLRPVVFWCDVVEDVKGIKTAVYRLKKRLVEAFHSIQIREVQG